MAKIHRGVTFEDGERLTTTKLNNLINLATVDDVNSGDFSGNVRTLSYGTTAPPLTYGSLWYDTTPGLEGLKYAFISPSSASIAGYCYCMPRREAYYWTASAVSAGMPLVVSRTQFGFSGLQANVYDGLMLPAVWYYSAHSGGSWAYASIVVAMESAAAAMPVKCAWAGLIPGWTGGSDVTQGNGLFVNVESNNLSMKNAGSGGFSARQLVLGTVLHNTSNPTFAGADFLMWGSGVVRQDIV